MHRELQWLSLRYAQRRYIDQCRIVEAWDALKNFRNSAGGVSLTRCSSTSNGWTWKAARILVLLGRCENAFYFARRCVEKPHRIGFVMTDSRHDAFEGDLQLLYGSQPLGTIA